MSTIEITKRMGEASPVSQSKVVIAYYLLSVATGVFFFFVHGRWGFAGDLVAAVIYLTATALFCGLSVMAYRWEWFLGTTTRERGGIRKQAGDR